MESLKVLELFSGIGGMHFALKKSGIPGEIVSAVEINPLANDVYKHNFQDIQLQNRNVQFLTDLFIQKHKIDTILMSPPCQPFTRTGNQKDITDPRTDAFKHICDLIPKLNTVNKILVENVKGFDVSKARDLLIESLQSGGYYFQEFLISPVTLGIPNSRTRYYCIARKGKEFAFQTNGCLENFPNFHENDSKLQRREVKEFIDENVSLNFYISDDILKKYSSLMDICTPESLCSTCFTKAYTRYIEGTGSVFTSSSKTEVDLIYNNRENDESFLKNLKKLNLRFFTPNEVAKLMSFPDNFSFPHTTTNKQKYKLLGNSLNILVVSELIKLLCSN